MRNLAAYDWLILTSVNGVDAMFDRMAAKKIDTPGSPASGEDSSHWPGNPGAIEKRGLRVAVTPKEYVAESVVAALHRRVRGKRVLLVRAKVARDVIPRELCKAGAQVDVVEAYETIVPNSSAKRLRTALAGKRRPHAITFTSSSTVKNFVGLLGLRGARAALKKTVAHRGVCSASIGPVTSATLREFDLPVDIEASEYTIPGLTAAIVSYKNRG